MLCRSRNLGLNRVKMTPAVTRTSMIAKHLSTLDLNNEAVVKFEAIHSLRKMTLNRPRALNALNKEMIELIKPQLEKWESSPLANIILFKGIGKSFCAGGDVVTLVKQLETESEWKKSAEFFELEYSTDAFIAKMKKVIVTIMQGNTLGGGVGLSAHAPFRIATESTKIAMPETTIGLFPDVGATFFLSRLDGQLGIYLGLTSDRIEGAGAVMAGLATHFVPTERLEALETRLGELSGTAGHEEVNAAIEEFAGDVKEMECDYALVGARRRAIDYIFAKETAEEIVAGLETLASGSLVGMKNLVVEGEELEKLKKWAKETKETILKRSPTSVKVTLIAIREGKSLNIDEAFQLDMRLATACCNPVVHPDFKVGVNHLLIQADKDLRKTRANWSPATLEEVKISSIQDIFFSAAIPFSNPPLPKLSLSNTKPYKVYPHVKYSLPSQLEIEDLVKGNSKSSGNFAVTEAEVIDILVKGRKGKVGVREKVKEVLGRCTIVGEENTLIWSN